MRRWAAGLLAVSLGWANCGCIMVIGVREPIELCDDKHVVEIDGQMYMLDLETNRIKKVDHKSIHEVETTTTVETKTD